MVELTATAGDRVVLDQVIARIDAREQGLLLEQLEARLDVLDHEAAMLGYRDAELRGCIEQQRLDVAGRTIRSPIDAVVDRTNA